MKDEINISSVKLQYGLRNGKIISIWDLNEEDRGLKCNCICPNCGMELQAKLGSGKKQRHFSHNNANCNVAIAQQTALHMLAKEIIEEEKVESSSNSLNGKSFCFTGAMKNKRKDLEAKVLDFGGIVHDGIKKNPLTDYLVIADINSTSSKAIAARKLGVNLISEDNFLEMCK